MLKLYELVSNLEDGVSFSPFVIAAELMLKHKGLEFSKVPITWSEVGPKIKQLTGDKWSKVPTIEFSNGDIIFDSLKIAQYLDKTHPNNPLIHTSTELDELIEDYHTNINPWVARLLVNTLYDIIDEASRPYFKHIRETQFNQNLDQIEGDYETNIINYYTKTEPIAQKLSKSPFLDGEEPKIHDYYLMGRVQQVKSISFEVYEALILNHPSEAFKGWVCKMEGLYDGYLRDRKFLA